MNFKSIWFTNYMFVVFVLLWMSLVECAFSSLYKDWSLQILNWWWPMFENFSTPWLWRLQCLIVSCVIIEKEDTQTPQVLHAPCKIYMLVSILRLLGVWSLDPLRLICRRIWIKIGKHNWNPNMYLPKETTVSL